MNLRTKESGKQEQRQKIRRLKQYSESKKKVKRPRQNKDNQLHGKMQTQRSPQRMLEWRMMASYLLSKNTLNTYTLTHTYTHIRGHQRSDGLSFYQMNCHLLRPYTPAGILIIGHDCPHLTSPTFFPANYALQHFFISGVSS